MTEEEINIKIAEYCGWTDVGDHRDKEGGITAPFPVITGYPPSRPIIGHKEHIPNYCNDLNTMHEVEEMLSGADRSRYFAILCAHVNTGLDGYFAVVHASARVRANAFLTLHS